MKQISLILALFLALSVSATFAQNKTMFGAGFYADFAAYGLQSKNYSVATKASGFHVSKNKVFGGFFLLKTCLSEVSTSRYENYQGIELKGGYFLLNNLMLGLSGNVQTIDFSSFNNYGGSLELDYYFYGMYLGAGVSVLSAQSSNFAELPDKSFNFFLRAGFNFFLAKSDKDK